MTQRATSNGTSHNDTDAQALKLTVRRGSLYIPQAIYNRYFQDLSAVILLRSDNDLLIMPVMHAAAGGYLLKLKNSRGDRVVNAMDFFRAQDLDDFFEAEFFARWSTDKAGLVAEGFFSTAN